MTLPKEREKYQELSARKHGTRAVEMRGKAAMDQAQRGRLAEITELTQDREGLVNLLRERVSMAVLIAELAEGWIQKQAAEDVPLDKMTMLTRITTYQANAQRAISALLAADPGEKRKNITEYLQTASRDVESKDNG